MRRAKRKVLALGAAMALTFGTAGSANAAAYQWQGYTRDGSWHCGPAGSTVYVDNLYLLACVKTAGADWQAILIATATSQAGYLWDWQIEWNLTSIATQVNAGECNPVDLDPSEIGPNESLACFSPTVYSPNSYVDGEFQITVASDPAGDDPQEVDLWGPGTQTSN